MNPKIVIVGAGLGGLSTALRLVSQGYVVEIVEKHHRAGGRLNQLKKDGFTFDLGPTFFSMSYEFKELAETCKMNIPFEFVELDPLYTVHFKNNPRTYIIYKELSKLSETFADEKDFEKKIQRYLKDTGATFHDTIDLVVKRNFDNYFEYLRALASVPLKHLPKIIRTFWKEVGLYFDTNEARQIFSLVAFFLGATPFDTPSIYTILNYTELKHDGYHNVKGGMYNIVEGMLKVLKERGVSIHYNTEIMKVFREKGEIKGVQDQHGNVFTGDAYVINADAASFRGQLLHRSKYKPERLDKMHWTLGPLTMYLGIKGRIDKLDHHNYFLGTNFKEYASKVFKNSIALDKPYYYVNVPSRSNPEMAPDDCEAVFVLVPVPDLRFKPDWSDKDKIVDYVLEDLSEYTGYDIRANLVSKTILDPSDWEKMFNLYRGSGLGLAHDLLQIGYLRPKNVDEEYDNLFYVGASTIPGTGLPMTIISSKLVTERINKRFNL